MKPFVTGFTIAIIIYITVGWIVRLIELEEVILAVQNKIEKHDTLFKYNNLRVDILEDIAWFKEEKKEDNDTETV